MQSVTIIRQMSFGMFETSAGGGWFAVVFEVDDRNNFYCDTFQVSIFVQHVLWLHLGTIRNIADLQNKRYTSIRNVSCNFMQPLAELTVGRPFACAECGKLHVQTKEK